MRRRSLVAVPTLVVVLAVAAALFVGPGRTTSADAASARPESAIATVPQGFVGVDVDGPVTAVGTTVNLAAQMHSMVAAGVQTIRVAFNWAAAEPVYSSWAQVPVDQRSQYTDVHGVPVDFSQTDAIVGDAARMRLAVLPTILYAPDWDGVSNPAGVDYPRTPGPYAAYAAALVGRYGPHGSFWSEHRAIPKVPITEWQIWNEPDLAYYWKQPFVSGYTALLRAAHSAIKRADPAAKIVLGALTNRAWVSLGQLERQPGFAHLFDIASVNGFTKLPANVIRYLQYVRRALNRDGDRSTPLLATELSWPSALGQSTGSYDFDTTQAGQAKDIAALLPLIGADRTSLNLVGFEYYTWMSAEAKGDLPFAFAGLLADEDGHVHVKPALAAFRAGALALEGCRTKGPVATDCRH